MRARNFGRIVFVSSESGVQISTEMIHYGRHEDGADRRRARPSRETLVGTNVTVNSVSSAADLVRRSCAASSPSLRPAREEISLPSAQGSFFSRPARRR